MSARGLTSLIAGVAVPGQEERPDVNPSDLGDVVAVASIGGPEVAQAAVAAAADAFPAWSRTTPWQRAEVLDRAGTEIIARADELGDLLAREEGKTLSRGARRGGACRADPQVLRRRRAPAARAGAGLRAARHRGHGDPRAGRRRQRHHAVELPDRHPGLEDRPGPRVRQHGGLQARRPRPGQRLGARRHPQPRGSAGRGAQPRPGARLAGRARPDRRPGRRGDHVHRLGRHRPRHPRIDGRPRREGPAGARRQEPAGRHRPSPASTSPSSARCRAGSARPASGARRRRSSSSRTTSTTPSSTRWPPGCASGASATHGPPVSTWGRSSTTASWSRTCATSTSRAPRERTSSAGAPVDAGTSGHFLAPALAVGTSIGDTINREEVFGPVMSVVRVADYDEALDGGQREHDEPVRRHLHDRPRRGVPLQAELEGRHGDGEPADGGRGLPRAVRRTRREQPRAARAGHGRRRVLHDVEDRLHRRPAPPSAPRRVAGRASLGQPAVLRHRERTVGPTSCTGRVADRLPGQDRHRHRVDRRHRPRDGRHRGPVPEGPGPRR